ncbi:MAG: hypothetical protein DRN30_01310 [Thermoplasmata archaeon]|nr:MAG: hypothetical protein DRN30_01310 [Thermoplasmata archaeon]
MNCLDDGKIAIRGKRIVLISRKAASVLPVNVAPNDVLIIMRHGRGKPAPIAKVFVVAQI